MSWEAVKGVQELCLALRSKEKEWFTAHFAERKEPRWLILAQALRSLQVFKDKPEPTLRDWEAWLEHGSESSSAVPPLGLVLSGEPLGERVLKQAGLSVEPRWVQLFSEKPADTQVLVWLHMQVFRHTDDPWLDRLLWNVTTVIQNSPLPLATKALHLILNYSNKLPIPKLASVEIPDPNLDYELNKWDEWAQRGGVKEEWLRALFETLHFASSPTRLKSELARFLRERGERAPEPENVYELLRKLDHQNGSPPLAATEDALNTMLHITHSLSFLSPQQSPIHPAVHQILEQLFVPLLQLRNSKKLVPLAHILHIHSLMSLAQMRRAAALFWTLAFAFLQQQQQQSQ